MPTRAVCAPMDLLVPERSLVSLLRRFPLKIDDGNPLTL